MKTLALLAATLLATTAIPAAAKPITYTFTGIFGGTIANNAFSNTAATFIGRGDTATTGSPFVGYTDAEVLGVPLTSLIAIAGATTFTVTSPASFYLYNPPVAGAPTTRLGLAFDNSGGNALGLESSAFASYDGLSTFTPPTPAPTYFDDANFTTNAGAVVIDSFTNGTFSAVAVPEPATWAFMIVGFGAIGGAMRRRNRQVTMTVRYA